MICGSCGMRMDGAAVLACKVRDVRHRAGRARAGDLGDGQPADRQGPRRRHGAVLGQVPRRRPVPPARVHRAARRPGARDLAGADERRSTRSRSASTAAAASRSATRWSRARSSSARRRSRRRCASSAIPRDGAKVERLESAERRARDLGVHPLLLLQRALPEGRRPARRDREARRRVDQGGDRPRHGREAREVVRHLGEDDRLAARDGARAEDAGHRRVDQADAVRARARQARQGAAAVPAARREGRARGARGCTTCCASRAGDGYAGIVQGERALAKLAHGHDEGERDPYGEGSFPRPFLPSERRGRRR